MIDDYIEIITRKLKGLRAECGLSLEEVANRVGCHRETLRLYEKDCSKVDTKLLLDLLKVYNVEPSYFFATIIGKMPND